MKDRLCQYGNCQNTNVAVTVNRNGERAAFCCDQHAAKWLLNFCSMAALDEIDVTSLSDRGASQ